jgi:hypothetical protein
MINYNIKKKIPALIRYFNNANKERSEGVQETGFAARIRDIFLRKEI